MTIKASIKAFPRSALTDSDSKGSAAIAFLRDHRDRRRQQLGPFGVAISNRAPTTGKR